MLDLGRVFGVDDKLPGRDRDALRGVEREPVRLGQRRRGSKSDRVVALARTAWDLVHRVECWDFVGHWRAEWGD